MSDDEDDNNETIRRTRARALDVLGDLFDAMRGATLTTPTTTIEMLMAAEMLASLNRRLARDTGMPIQIAKAIQRIASKEVGSFYDRVIVIGNDMAPPDSAYPKKAHDAAAEVSSAALASIINSMKRGTSG